MRPVGCTFLPAVHRGGGRSRVAGVAMAVLSVAACGSPEVEFWTLAAEESLAIGAEPLTPETAFYRPSALGLDAQDVLYVLDSGNHRVQLFAADGSYRGSRGRQGAGPGDLDSPEDLWVEPDGGLVVADTGNRRIARFRPDGTSLTPLAVEFVPVGVVGFAAGLFVLRLPTAAMLFGPETEPLVYRIDGDDVIAGGAVTPQPHDTGIVYFLANTFRMAGDPGGGFALADVHIRGRVRRFGPEAADALETFGVLYKADALAPLGWLPRQVDEQSVQRVARTTMDLYWDAYQSLFWVLAGYVDRSADGEWVQGIEVHRYAPDGDYRGSVVLPVPAVRIAVTSTGELWALDRDGVARRYRIRDVEGGPGWR